MYFFSSLLMSPGSYLCLSCSGGLLYVHTHTAETFSTPPTPVSALPIIKWCLSIMRQAFFEGELSFQSFLLWSEALCVLITRSQSLMSVLLHTHTVTLHSWFLCNLQCLYTFVGNLCLSTSEHRTTFYCSHMTVCTSFCSAHHSAPILTDVVL